MGPEQLAADLRRHVEALARTPRPPGSAAHQQAQEYVGRHLQQAGFTPRPRTYRQAGFDWTNLLTEPFPDDPRLPLFVVGAHYDSTPHTPGADDNASAVAALLELARWARPRLEQHPGPWRARLQLVAYDMEEYGLIGSRAHAQELQILRTPVLGMLSLEMLSYVDDRPGSQRLPPHLAHLYPDVGNFIGVVGNDRSAALLRVVTEAMRSVPGLPVEALAVPGDGELLPETRLSDHSSFWDHGFAALMLTDTSFFRNPHYHQSTDTPETLDYAFLARVTAGVCAATWRVLTDDGERQRNHPAPT